MTALSVSLICVFLQVALTYWAIVRMGMYRVGSLQSRTVKLGDIALGSDAFPEQVKPFQNNAHNQFETPILLYAVVGLGAAVDGVNWGVAAGAVLFIVSRLVHRYIHVGKNDVRVRFKVYLGGLIGLAISWVSLGLGLIGLF